MTRSDDVTSACDTGRGHLGQQREGSGQGRDRAAVQQLDHAAHHPASDGLPALRAAGPGEQVVQGALQRSADQLLLVSRVPGAAQPGHDGALDFEPERLGVDQQAVHVEHDGLQGAARRRIGG